MSINKLEIEEQDNRCRGRGQERGDWLRKKIRKEDMKRNDVMQEQGEQ
jgi:hypothetical protein